MKIFKSLFLPVILCISMLFSGCTKNQADTTSTLTDEEYIKKLKSIVKVIFEENNYVNRNGVLAFTKDMNLKAQEDEEINKWYYNDQIYLLTIQKMYLDLYNKISKINSSDDVTASIHKSIIAQLEDLNKITSTLLQEYRNSDNPQSLNSSIPSIKLIFTDNPNEYTVSQIIRNEVNGRIKRVNSSIGGIISITIKDVSQATSNSSNGDSNVEKETKANQSSEDNISKAKQSILEAIKNTELNGTNIILDYMPNTGTEIDGNKYYAFGAGDGYNTFDCIYIVDKSTFEVYEFYADGNMINISGGKSSSNQSQNSSQTPINNNQNQIPGGISSEEALNILEKAYNPKYVYTSDFGAQGKIDYEAFDEVNAIESPAYQFGFIDVETGYRYIAWVFGNGNYKMRCIEGMD